MNDLIFIHKVETETEQAVFLPKFQKSAHTYPATVCSSSKLNYIKQTFQLSRLKYRISVRGPTPWNEFLTDSEKEIENLSLFKSKIEVTPI